MKLPNKIYFFFFMPSIAGLCNFLESSRSMLLSWEIILGENKTVFSFCMCLFL